MSQKFGAIARIVYEIKSDTVAMQMYAMNGRAYSGLPKMIKPAALPVLMFQLIDAGYSVQKEKQDGNVMVILAASEEWLEMERSRR